MRETIVITGIGMMTPLGCGKDRCWNKIKNGKSLMDEPIPKNFEPELSDLVRFVPLENLNGLYRIFPLVLRTVQEALSDANINLDEFDPESIGCSISVSKPIFASSPFSVFSSLSSPDSVNQYLAHELKICGPTENVIAACATGVHSILIASRWLQEGRCDIAIAGSAESSLHPLYISGFQKMGVLSDFPCPFDKRRKGFIVGEGAGILILERKSDAISRKAKIYAEISGCAIGSDFNHPTAFDPEGASIASVLERAIKNARLQKQDIDYINLHGTGTRLNDLIETKAIKKVFGKEADRISLSSTKSATGHLLGAGGSVEAGIACLAIQDQFVPPTLNLEFADPECDLDYTPQKGKNKKIQTVISLSFGFGGPIGAVVFQKAA